MMRWKLFAKNQSKSLSQVNELKLQIGQFPEKETKNLLNKLKMPQDNLLDALAELIEEQPLAEPDQIFALFKQIPIKTKTFSDLYLLHLTFAQKLFINILAMAEKEASDGLKDKPSCPKIKSLISAYYFHYRCVTDALFLTNQLASYDLQVYLREEDLKAMYKALQDICSIDFRHIELTVAQELYLTHWGQGIDLLMDPCVGCCY
jgi:hypothetical protein